MRLYGEIIPDLKLGDYQPNRRTNHALSHLYHDNQCRPCTLRSISCLRLGICGLWYNFTYFAFSRYFFPFFSTELKKQDGIGVGSFLIFLLVK